MFGIWEFLSGRLVVTDFGVYLMRPPVCAVCDAKWDCDLVWFAQSQRQEEFEKRMKEIGRTGHPPDAEWLCKEHATTAAKYKHLTLAEAWPKIKAEIAGRQGSQARQDMARLGLGQDSPARPRPAQTAERTLGVRTRGRLFGEGNDLFIYIETDLRNLYELKVGDRIECVLIAIERAPQREYCSCEGELVGGSSSCRPEQFAVRSSEFRVPSSEFGEGGGSSCRPDPAHVPFPSKKYWWDIVNYWNELHVPPAMAAHYALQAGDNIECEWLEIERS